MHISLLLFPTWSFPHNCARVLGFFNTLWNLGKETQTWKMALSSWNYHHLNEWWLINFWLRINGSLIFKID